MHDETDSVIKAFSSVNDEELTPWRIAIESGITSYWELIVIRARPIPCSSSVVRPHFEDAPPYSADIEPLRRSLSVFGIRRRMRLVDGLDSGSDGTNNRPVRGLGCCERSPLHIQLSSII